MTNIKKIHNAVFVSDRIITYKAAAAILGLDIKETRKVLKDYVNNLKNNDEVINVSYVVGGITLTDEHVIKIVSQSKYEEVKSCFKTITINQIYSIQKSPLKDWTPIFNVDDFLICKKKPPAEVCIKTELESTKPAREEAIQCSKFGSKKGTISNLFAQQNNTIQNKSTEQKSIKVGIKKETVKQEKIPLFSSFFNKTSNKENVSKVNNITVKNEAVNDDDDEEIFKVSKKRTRLLSDDEDDENPAKSAKVDILDDIEEEPEKEYQSDEDLFGSPEKDEELMQTEESSEKDTQNSVSDNNTENGDTMYEGDDGYFVTEKTPNSKNKQVKQEIEKQFSKKESIEMKQKDKEEKKIKKIVIQKLKNSTNQKSILNFFQKK